MRHDTDFLLYGANGYSGRLIAREAIRRGLRPRLAGRNERAIAALAEELGLPWSSFSLDDGASVDRAIAETGIVLAAAGPFSQTFAPLLDASVRTRSTYLDINGDIRVFQRIFARRAELEAAGACAIPGVGFDVAPSDCIGVRLARELPGATHLEIAWGGDFEPSRGTARSMLDALPRGGLIRERGELVRVSPTHETSRVTFPSGPTSVLSVPWGDVVTAYDSTGIPNIKAFAAMNRGEIFAVRMMRPFLPLLRWRALRSLLDRWISKNVTGPSDHLLEHGRSFFFARVRRGEETRAATVTGPEGYVLTARSAIEAVRHVTRDRSRAGVLTPARAFGDRFIDTVEGCASWTGAEGKLEWRDARRARDGELPRPALLETAR